MATETITKARRDEIIKSASPWGRKDATTEWVVSYTLRELGIEVVEPEPPKPVVRPYTPKELVEHLGREVSYRGRYHYVGGVHLDHVELSIDDDGNIPRLGYQAFTDNCFWRGCSSPCGIVTPADAQGVR